MRKMMQCVPNFSEGRNQETIDAIVEPLKDKPGFKVVGVEPDKDYNRTVVTLLGDGEAMLEPLLKFVEKARNLIDMNKQSGEHPRMGAVDVIPFIPIRDATMDDCVTLANRMGEMIADTLAIPIFLYAEAARTKKRKRLPAIRKGEFEGMKEKIQEATWEPDFGKPAIHQTAGATAVGARLPLIAYNIDLATDDLEIAKKIARAIRGSSGGFKHIQAGPVYLDERKHVQVTMNILNYKQNPIYRIFETVKMEAKRYHIDVPSSEIVGLIPQDAIERSLKYYFTVEKRPLPEETPIEALTKYARTHLKFRDFDELKIIEANIDMP